MHRRCYTVAKDFLGEPSEALSIPRGIIAPDVLCPPIERAAQELLDRARRHSPRGRPPTTVAIGRDHVIACDAEVSRTLEFEIRFGSIADDGRFVPGVSKEYRDALHGSLRMTPSPEQSVHFDLGGGLRLERQVRSPVDGGESQLEWSMLRKTQLGSRTLRVNRTAEGDGFPTGVRLGLAMEERLIAHGERTAALAPFAEDPKSVRHRLGFMFYTPSWEIALRSVHSRPSFSELSAAIRADPPVHEVEFEIRDLPAFMAQVGAAKQIASTCAAKLGPGVTDVTLC